MSFHSGHRGFACDDVLSYEVVLADGSIVNANTKDNASLFKALKGGGNNFGIVTRFDMAAFPAGKIYAGLVFTTWDQKDIIVNNLVNMIDINEDHPVDSQVVLFTYKSGSESPGVITEPVSVDGNTNSSSFALLQGLPSTLDTRAMKTYSEFIIESADTNGR